MGMHFGLIAVKAPLSELRSAFSETWPELQIVGSADSFRDAEEVWAWKTANERRVSAAEWTKDDPGSAVYVFCEDGPWSVLMDFSYVLPGDEEALKRLSARFGSVLSFIVETTGGCAYFWNYESGQLRRMIENVDGKLEFFGESLPQEVGIDINGYYMEETIQLMRAFGLSNPEDLPVVSTAVAIAAADRTDYTELTSPRDTGAGTLPQDGKPWWKVW